MIVDLEEVIPSAISLVRPVSKLEQATNTARRVVRRIAIGIAALVVFASLLVLGVMYLRSRAADQPTPTAAEEMLASKTAMGFSETKGSEIHRGRETRLRLTEGKARVFAAAYGRPARFAGEKLRFEEGPSGHAVLMAQGFEGDTVELSAKVHLAPPDEGLFARFKRFILGTKPRPAGGVLLLGDEDRYVSLLASTDEPITLEWALGDKRGRTLLHQETATREATLTLRVDLEGRLSARAKIGDTTTAVGEPLRLGSSWKSRFSLAAPLPGLGCTDGACTFEALEYDVAHAPPKPPPPRVVRAPPPPPKAKKRSRKKRRR